VGICDAGAVSPKAAQPDVEIRLLGELEVRRGGRAQTLPASKKSRALLAYLVATGRPHLRESLCTLLWDGPDDPRAELRWCLSKIRPLLDAGGGQLVADRERAGFAAGPARVDAAAVRELVAGGVEAAPTETLRAGAAIFRGEFLEGLDLPASFRYHEWCVAERESLRALRIRILSELVERLSGAPAELEEALRWARQRVTFDPLTEAAHVDVIRILGRLGRTREALAQYDTCRRILETELGARASSALEQARRDLTAGRTDAAADPPQIPAPREAQDPSPREAGRGLERGAPAEPQRPPLVGRDAARAAVTDAVTAARDAGAPPALLFVGDPGIGKTRLLDLVADEIRAAGGTVLRGRAFEAETVRPYGPWIDALSGAAPPPDVRPGPDLAPLLPALARPPSAIEPAGDRGRLHDAAGALLERWATSAGPLALLIDDLQWLDEASASLLHFVTRGRFGGRILIACAARAGELGDNPAALRVVRALDRERLLTQHRLEPLGPAETAAIVRAISPTANAAAAFAASEGNPLFAIEIARAAAAGAETQDEPLDRLLDERLERLSEPARDLLPWAAALGRSFDPEVLALVRGGDAVDLVDALDHLERHGVIRATSGAACDFTHDLLRQAAYRRLSPARRRLVHLQIARALAAARAGDDTIAGEIAHHATLGGDALLAAQSALAAGQRCLRVYAYAEAAELATRGLQQLPRIERMTRIRLQIALGAVLVESGGTARAVPGLEAELSRAIVEAQEAGLHEEAALGFRTRAFLYYTGEKFEAARESTFRAVEETRRTDVTMRGRELAVSARCLMLLENEVPEAQAMIGEARGLLGAEAERLPTVAWASALLARYLGDHAAATAAFAAAIEGFDHAGAHWERFQAMAQKVMLDLETGHAADARAQIGALVEVAGKMHDGSERAIAAALAVLAERAVSPVATTRLEEAIRALVAADTKAMLAYVLNAAATQDLDAGDVAAAEERAGAALAAAAVVGRRSEIAVARSLLGRAALARGDDAPAKAHLDALWEDRKRPLGLSGRAFSAANALATALQAAVTLALTSGSRSQRP
jgi:predicted ATPase/DNA-binding SARP family transcriptional activator